MQKQLPVPGLGRCPKCGQLYWTPPRFVIWNECWVVLYCGCQDTYMEFSKNWMKKRGIWPPPLEGTKVQLMNCLVCGSPLTRQSDGKIYRCNGTISGADCEAVYHEDDEGNLVYVYPDF